MIHMFSDKLKILKIVLYLGALYYFIGAFVHFFGITLFPFFDNRLFSPYHDSIVSTAALVIALFFITVARNPKKNIDTLNTIIICAVFAGIASILIIWKVDFDALGAPDKKIQTVVEGILCFILVSLLLWLHPRKAEDVKLDKN